MLNEEKVYSFRQMLALTPEELTEVDPASFRYARAKDLPKFSPEQFMALHPEHIKVLKPIHFSEVDVRLLDRMLGRLQADPKADDTARKIIQEAINKAKDKAEEKAKIEALRQMDGMITPTDIRADVVAAKLDITMRYLYDLAHDQRNEKTGEVRPAEIIMYKRKNMYICDYQSVLDYLNRQRRVGAVFEPETGRPLLQPEEVEKLDKIAEIKAQLKAEGKAMPKKWSEELQVDYTNYIQAEVPPVTDIPLLQPVEDFANEMDLDVRTFIRNCNAGYYDYFRIGNQMKMSREDYVRSYNRAKEAVIKSTVYSTAPKAQNQ